MDKNLIYKTIASNIKKYRKQEKMTQRELAQAVGISMSSVMNVENGRQCMGIANLIKTSKILDVTLDELVS